MKNVVWNTTVKELNGIIKRIGYAVYSERMVNAESTEQDIECACLRFSLNPLNTLSTFIALDGYRMATVEKYVRASDSIDFLVNCKKLQAIVKQLGSSNDEVCITIGDKEMEIEASGQKITCEIKEPKIDLEKLTNMCDMDVMTGMNTWVKDLMAIGDKERVSSSKTLYLQPYIHHLEDGSCFEFEWSLEQFNEKKRHGYLPETHINGKTKARDRFSRVDWTKEVGTIDTLTHVYVNYQYFRQALKALPLNSEVRLLLGTRPIHPLMIATELDTEKYSAVILPIVINGR